MVKKHDMDPNTHTQTERERKRAARGEWMGLVVAHQHHGQWLTHRSPIRAAVTRQPVSQTLTAGLDEDREPLV